MRRYTFYLSIALLLFGLIVVCSVSKTLGQDRHFNVEKEYRLLTQKLPAIDRVELLKLKKDADLRQGGIETAKTLKGIEAKNAASLWRTQTYRPGLSACHNPIYGIKFYSGDKLIVYASVCWDCNTIGFEKPYINDTQQFDGTDEKGQQLLKLFQDAFPEKN